MKQERGTIYALKVLLFGLLPLVAVGLLIFYSYARSREISLIERNYRVLETAKRQLQDRFEGRTIAYRRFISKKTRVLRRSVRQKMPALRGHCRRGKELFGSSQRTTSAIQSVPCRYQSF